MHKYLNEQFGADYKRGIKAFKAQTTYQGKLGTANATIEELNGRISGLTKGNAAGGRAIKVVEDMEQHHGSACKTKYRQARILADYLRLLHPAFPPV